MTSPYDILGVDPGSTPDEIRKAYRSKAQSNHPDKGGDSETFHAIKTSFEILGDEGRRAHFDECGQDKGSDTLESRVTSALGELFASLLEIDEHSNIIDMASKAASANLAGVTANIKKLERKIEQVQRQRGRVVTDDPDNIFAGVVDAQLTELRRQKAHHASSKELIEGVCDRLSTYRDKGYKPRDPAGGTATGTVGFMNQAMDAYFHSNPFKQFK